MIFQYGVTLSGFGGSKDAMTPNAELGQSRSPLKDLVDKGWFSSGHQAVASDPEGLASQDGWHIAGLARLTPNEASPTNETLTGQSALLALLRAHQTQGPEGVGALSGAFSCVLWHAEEKQFWAYRDGFGVYPLVYVKHGSQLSLSSCPRLAMHLSGLPLTPNRLRIADYVAGKEIDQTLTAFEALKRLPSAHCLSDAEGELEALAPQRFWTLPKVATPEIEIVPAQVKLLLSAATEHCMDLGAPAQDRIGAMLSGGLDSTAIAGLAAQKIKPKRLKTISFVYGPNKPYDESAYIDAANEMFTSDVVKVHRSRPPDLSATDQLIDEQFDLFLSPGLPKSREIYSHAAEAGLDVLLDGHGGDECISHGLGRLKDLAASGDWSLLWRNVPGLDRGQNPSRFGAFLGFAARYGPLKKRSLRRRVMAKVARYLLRSSLVPTPPQSPIDLLVPVLRTELGLEDRYSQKPKHASSDPQKSAAQTEHIEVLETPLIVHAFEVLHRAGAAAGVEPRYPFYDTSLVAFCVAAPPDAKLRDGRARWMLREAMRGIMPDKVCDRVTKADFSEEMKASVDAFYMSAPETVFDLLEGVIDTNMAKQLRADLKDKGLPIGSYQLLWRLAILSKWSQALPKWQSQQSQGQLVS
ncbi:MAG: asparagine synthase-related protein [Pseudomonadota bacterium]